MTRAFDQIRMSRYSEANIKFVGSHAGVSIGEDGPSQMGLEDISMFRTVRDSVIFYPSDAISTEKVVEEAAKHKGIVYIRTTRADTPIIYRANEEFPVGGSKVLRQSDKDVATVVGAGITLHAALAAYDELKKEGVLVRVIDLYCIKPIDQTTLRKAGSSTSGIITVEDHYPEGGIGEAVRTALADFDIPIYSLAVNGVPRSGRPEELLSFEEISPDAIIARVKELL
jgi:transketolase